MDSPVESSSAVAYCPERTEFLVLKRSGSKEEHPNQWEFPGGIVEANEEPRNAALRELEEETGLEGVILRSGKAGVTHVSGRTYRVHPFLVKVPDKEAELSEEHVEYRWTDAEGLRGLNTVEGLRREMRSLDLLEEPEKVSVAVARAGQDVLVLKRSKLMPTNAGKWEFASGRIEGDETPSEAAARELEEETGIYGEPARTGEPFVVETDGEEFRVHPVLVEVELQEPELSFEHDEYRWMSPEKLKELDTVAGLQNDLERLDLL